MKKYLFSIMMLCMAFTNASAQNTLKAVDLSAEAGDDVYLEFNLTNAAKIRTIEFTLQLPEGVTIDDLESVQLNNARLGTGDDHAPMVNKLTSGDYKFLIGSSKNTPFTGNDGVVFSVIINIANTVAVGAHSIYVKDLLLTDSETDAPYETASLESTLTITGVSDGSVKLNENSTTLPIAQSGVNVKVTRTLVGGKWNSLCLPFKMTLAQTKAAFGDGVIVGTLASVEGDNASGFTLNFTKRNNNSNQIQANTPIIIKPDADLTEFTVTGVNITNPAALIEKENEVENVCKFYGTEIAGQVIPENCLFFNSSKVYYSKGTTTIKAFRAYLYIEDFDYAAAPSFDINVDGEATDINELEIMSNDGRIYNLKGQHVENPTEKGVYIKNGKKVVIK